MKSRRRASAEVFRELDERFADFICRLAGTADPRLRLVAGMLSRAVGNGHSCLDPAKIEGRLFSADAVPTLSPDERWERFFASPGVSAVIGPPESRRPIVRGPDGLLYLQRYWDFESSAAAALKELSRPRRDRTPPPDLGARLLRYFPAPPERGGDRQRLAAYAAWRNRLLIISGGPGTGKTYTAARIAAFLAEIGEETGFRIALAAPTGKAAARVTESMSGTVAAAAIPERIRKLLPRNASTIHRLLGVRSGTREFRHGPRNPLVADLVIVDEASMIALPQMARLLEALDGETRLILLGDMNQLASVEPGFVLGDICAAGGMGAFSPALLEDYRRDTGLKPEVTAMGPAAGGLSECLVELTYSHRFHPRGAIGALSRLVNRVEDEATAGEAWKRLRHPAREPGPVADASEVIWKPIGVSPAASRGLPVEELEQAIREGYGPFLNAGGPAEALLALERFRVLCPFRSGTYGVERINRTAEAVLSSPDVGKHRLHPGPGWYDHRPVIITRNDYSLGLFNGDVGVILDDEGVLAAFFPPAASAAPPVPRRFPPALLPELETAFALTVHKAQGSEFDGVLLVLPPGEGPELTRELIYTGITRARTRVEVRCSETGFREAVLRRVGRHSGLAAALAAPASPKAAGNEKR